MIYWLGILCCHKKASLVVQILLQEVLLFGLKHAYWTDSEGSHVGIGSAMKGEERCGEREMEGKDVKNGGRYIFFSDKVEIQDITKQTSMCALLGPKSSKIMDELNLGDLVGKPYGSHKHYSVNGMPLTVAVGSTISVDGFTFMMAPAVAESVRKALMDRGAVSMSPSAWETLRILQGRPAPGKELTQEYNVLEAGLWRAVSLNKGCYKGQETIARLVTYDGIKQTLWGIRLSSPVVAGSIITVGGKKVGTLTSYTDGTKTSGPFGLGYIKSRTASEGDSVTVGDGVVGTLVEVPFLKDQRPPLKA